MDVNANEAFAILMREIRSPVDCLTEASVDHFESIVLKHLDKLQARVRELEEGLQGFIDLANESQGVTGWHLNGDVLLWEEVEQLTVAHDLLHQPKGTP